MSCTNFKAHLIKRMYSLVVKRQSKASYRGLLDLLAVHFKGRENKDIVNTWCNIPRTAFSWKNQSDTNGFFHPTFSRADITSVTFLYQTSPVYPKHFFSNDLTAYSLDTESALTSGQYRRGCQRLTKEKRAIMNIHKKANQNECISTIKGAFEVCSADTLG